MKDGARELRARERERVGESERESERVGASGREGGESGRA